MRKSSKYVTILVGLVIGLSMSSHDLGELNSVVFKVIEHKKESSKTPPTKLTEKDWEEAKEGIDYGSPKPPKKEPEPDDPIEDSTTTEDDSPSWFERLLDDLSGLSINQKFLSAFLVGMVILLLVWLTIKLITNHQQNKKINLKSNELHFALDKAEENLEESDLDRLLRLSLEKEDYKSAIRVYYLSVLKMLSLAGYIKWKKDKTNADYLAEMSGNNAFENFKLSTITFEKIWYGDLEISAEDYRRLSPIFKRLLHQKDNG